MENIYLSISLDALHTNATALGYAIQNLNREIEDAKLISDSVRDYKTICRQDAERELVMINEAIRAKNGMTPVADDA
jgi:hypothetical protein